MNTEEVIKEIAEQLGITPEEVEVKALHLLRITVSEAQKGHKLAIVKQEPKVIQEGKRVKTKTRNKILYFVEGIHPQ